MLFNGWGRVAGVENLGFIELEGKGTPVSFLTDLAEVATACRVLQKVVMAQDATRSYCCCTGSSTVGALPCCSCGLPFKHHIAYCFCAAKLQHSAHRA